jgi:sugar/nucleoside kinase (ribokinase family)
VDAERLQELVLGFRTCRVAVLGDFFLDKYLDVNRALAEVSLETGKAAHQVVSVRCSPGAAGTVVNNLAALAAGEIHALGFTGDDGEGYELRRGLLALGCDVGGLVSVPGRFTPTYLKPRDCGNPDLSGEHERYDTKNRLPAPADVQERVLAHLLQLLPGVDAVIVMDQVDEAECGIVTERVRAELARLGGSHPQKVFWADSRCRIGLFRNVMVKVNAREAVREAFGDAADASDDASVRQAMTELERRTGKPVFVTAGSRGIWVSGPEAALVPAVRVEEPTDPTGAGDSATAGAVLALCAGATLHEAALVANLVASITIQQLATTGTASPPQLGPRLEMWRRQTGVTS